jgi:hypothetical protein
MRIMRIMRKRELLRARDVAEQGLPTITLTRLVQADKLERVARGVYGLPGAATSEHRSLAEVAIRVPKGVVCLLCALQYHEILTQAPFEVWLAIPNRVAAPPIEQPSIRVVRMSDARRVGQGLDQVVHRAGGDALHVGLLDDGRERLLGGAPRLQETRGSSRLGAAWGSSARSCRRACPTYARGWQLQLFSRSGVVSS